MRRLDQRVWAFWLIGLLLTPAILALAGRYPNDVRAETGRPASPGFDLSRLLDDDYYAELDAVATDNLPIHGAGLWARAMVDYELFGDSTVDEVVVGADGWLYWAPSLEVPCADLAALSVPAAPEVTSEQLRVMVVSPKAAVHPEPLGGLRPCEIEARATWQASLAADPRVIDVNTAMVRQRERNPGHEFFRRRDTRWSPVGRVAAARLIVNSLGSDLWDAEALVATEDEPFAEELLRLMGIRRTATERGREVQRRVRPVVVTDQPFGSTGLLGVYETTMAGDDPVIPGTTLIVGDPHMEDVLPLIAPYFEHMVFVQTALIDLGWKVAQHRPDRVLVQSIESRVATSLTAERIGDLAAAIVPAGGDG